MDIAVGSVKDVGVQCSSQAVQTKVRLVNVITIVIRKMHVNTRKVSTSHKKMHIYRIYRYSHYKTM